MSEQNIIDCSYSFGNEGCDGGFISKTLQFIQENGGISTSTSYPFVDDEGTCKFHANKVNFTVQSIVKIPKGNERLLQEAIAFIGPIAASMDASHESFSHYHRGEIYYEPQWNANHLDHAVLVVGYDIDEYDREYYIVKNSYGSGWGDGGYFRIARNHMNHCGIATEAFFPRIEISNANRKIFHYDF